MRIHHNKCSTGQSWGLTKFWDKLSEFSEKLGEFAFAHTYVGWEELTECSARAKKLTELGVWNRLLRNCMRPVSVDFYQKTEPNFKIEFPFVPRAQPFFKQIVWMCPIWIPIDGTSGIVQCSYSRKNSVYPMPGHCVLSMNSKMQTVSHMFQGPAFKLKNSCITIGDKTIAYLTFIPGELI